MPFTTKKLKKGHVSVKNPQTGKVYSKNTTPEKAASQKRLLGMLHRLKQEVKRRV